MNSMTKVFTFTMLTFGLAAPGLSQQPQHAPTPTAQPQAAAPALTPNPEWTHQKLGIFVYPAKGQKPQQQQKDETECYQWSRSQTGIDPTAPLPAAAAPAPAQTGNPANGARVAGAPRGAAGGAVIGAISGDAGKGAAIGGRAGPQRQTNW